MQYDRTPGRAENFRSSDAFELSSFLNQTGWSELHVSGSASIASLEQIQMLHPSKENPVIVLDVREESHVIVGNYPGTWRSTNNWANVGKTYEEIMADEAGRIAQLKNQENVKILHRKDVKNQIANPRSVTLSRPKIFSEEEIVKQAGAQYVRLMVTDHLGPRKESVDAFIKMERAAPPNARRHVHCGVGQGRTGIFIAMIDMMKDAHRMPFSDIMNRQMAFNPGRALDLNKNVFHEGRNNFRNDRLEYIILFYEYARMNPGGRPKLWSEWLDDAAKGFELNKSAMP